MRSRGSKSFRFLQIISAANKQYTGARAPDRQQNQLLPLVFRLYSASLLSQRSQRLLLIVISQHFAAIFVLFIGRRYYLRPVSRFAAFAVAAKAMVSAIAFMAIHSARVQRLLLGTWCGKGERRRNRPSAMASIRLSWRLILRTVSLTLLFLKP